MDLSGQLGLQMTGALPDKETSDGLRNAVLELTEDKSEVVSDFHAQVVDIVVVRVLVSHAGQLFVLVLVGVLIG